MSVHIVHITVYLYTILFMMINMNLHVYIVTTNDKLGSGVLSNGVNICS